MDMRQTLGWILVSLVSACVVEPVDGELGSDGDEPAEFRAAPPVLAASAVACPSWRQVVRRNTEAPCGAVVTAKGTWTGTKLFGTTPGEYAKYCVYEFSGTPIKADTDALYGKDWVVEAAADCRVVVPQTGLDEVINPELRALTIDRLDNVSEAELDLDDTEELRAPIRIAVIDTTPHDDPATPRDDHGLVVADLIESIAHGCNSPETCNVIVDNVLGLARYGPGKTHTDPINGGFIAFHSEIAAAVHNTVLAWELSKNQNFQPKLIINFSVAWLKAFGGDPGASSPAVNATLLALRRASCQDALIIAAAGNESQDCVPGPMVPADWEKLAVPTQQECNNVMGVPWVSSPAPYKALVHSVGGLDYEDAEVSVTRDLGRPRLAAIAEHVVGSDVTDTARTGTSMSAAVVSGVAGLVWSYHSTLTSHEIIALIYGGGVPTGENAEYARSGVHEIKRATACSALAQSCLPPLACPGTFDLDCVVDPLETDALHDAITGLVPDSTSQITLTEFGECPGYCGDTLTRWVAPGAPAVCDPIPGTARIDYLVAPQPTNPACPACNWTTSGSPDQGDYVVTVNASLGGRYSQMIDTNVTIEMTLEDGTVWPAYDLGNANLSTTSRGLDLEPAPTSRVVSGKIHIRFAGMANPVSGDLLPPVVQ